MARNYYSEINLHLTWHTKGSLPLLTPDVEPLAHRYLKQRIINTPGAFVHEIGGTQTHVHVVVTIPPTLLISEFVGQLKGASAHEVNQQSALRDKRLQWQAGYGVVSFGKGDIKWVKAYVRNQRPAEPGVNAGPNTACGGKDPEGSCDSVARGWKQPSSSQRAEYSSDAVSAIRQGRGKRNKTGTRIAE